MIRFLFCFLFSLTLVDVSSQEWEPMASLPNNFTTDHAFGFAIDGVGYVVAGNVGGSPSGNGYSKSFYAYDPATDVWTQKEDFPGLARGFAIGEVWNGKAYFGFGASGSSSLDDLWSFDPLTDEWTQLASCDCNARTHPAMVALNGQIFLGLGGGTPTGNANDWWMYDIETDTWEQRASFPAAERHHPFQFTDGRYIFTGFGHGNGFISNQWYRYDPLDNTWIEVGTLPAEGRVAGTQMSHRGLGFVLSGDGDDHGVMPTGEFWMYDSEVDVWSTLPPHPGVSRWAPTSFIIDDVVYFMNGERNGGYFADNYKYDLSSLFEPTLLASVNDGVEDFSVSSDYCDASTIQKITIRTRLPFDVDANVTLAVSDESTAVEGQDFILVDTEAILPAGATDLTMDVILFDDAVVSDDKMIVLDFATDVTAGNDKVTIELVDNDKSFGADLTTLEYSTGEGSGASNAVFAAFYSNVRTQMLYKREILEEARIGSGAIDNLVFEMTSANPSFYIDYTVNIAHSNATTLENGFINNLDFQEVYSGNFTPSFGETVLNLQTPFEYDGTSNLLIQICFDNPDYTVDDPVLATEVDYTATRTLLNDFVTGCPQTGVTVTTNLLPNITVKKEQYSPVFASTNRTFQSTLDAEESLYFATNDSILVIVDYVEGQAQECISTQLVSSSDEIESNDDVDWVDRIYRISDDADVDSELEVTIIMPLVASFDYESEDLKVLYTDIEFAPMVDPIWQVIEPTNITLNPEFAAITFMYQGTGNYTAGGQGLFTSTTEVDINAPYDLITIYDIMGRVVYRDRQELPQNGLLPVGIYVAAYTYEGRLVRSEKLLR